MVDILSNETLQPSLLDRLADDEPSEKEESREKRVLSTKQLRMSVIRDLSWLLNANNSEVLTDMSLYPYAKKSVINYGMPDLSGRVAVGMDILQLEKVLKDTIVFFEPRIIKKSLSVHVAKTDEMDRMAINFDIEADLWAQPLPLHLYLKTELDLETGEITLENKR
jgi:type VI secretion system protein ImpF